MKSVSALIAIGSLAAVSACSTPGPAGEGQAAPTQWKEVTRIINGNSVTYRVPVNQKVPNDVNMHPFEPDATTPGAARPEAGAAAPSAAPRVSQPAPGAAKSSAISEEAEMALGRAEIAVRDAQSRFETARATLERAREAARAGDSASTVKFANTAVSISRPDH